MEFDPQTGGMKCRFCGQTVALAAPAARIAAHALAAFLEKGRETDDRLASSTAGLELRPLSAQALEVTCAGCGSTVAFEPPELAGACPFCGDALVAQPKAADALIAPDGVLPARITRQEAQTQVREWLQTRRFAPNALNRLARQESIAGVYLPFWAYDADTTSQYTGQRGEHYWETETYQVRDSDGDLETQTRRVVHTAWYPASGAVSRHFENVLAPASRSVAESNLNTLEPWDLDALCAYDPAYLAGFKAERYQVEVRDGYVKALLAMKQTIEQDIRRDIGGDEQRVGYVETQYANAMFRHLLLPVWIGAYRFQSKVYQVAVNARTGEVQGDRPYSTAKIALVFLALLAVIALFIVVRLLR